MTNDESSRVQCKRDTLLSAVTHLQESISWTRRFSPKVLNRCTMEMSKLVSSFVICCRGIGKRRLGNLDWLYLAFSSFDRLGD